MQKNAKLGRLQAKSSGAQASSGVSRAAAELEQQQSSQAAEFLLTRRLAARLFKTLIMVPLPMWQLKDCAAVIIAPINKAKATICFPALNTIYHLTNDCKGNIWCHAANYWLPFTNLGFGRLSSSCRPVYASPFHAEGKALGSLLLRRDGLSHGGSGPFVTTLRKQRASVDFQEGGMTRNTASC